MSLENSLYSKFLFEREGAEIQETEKGFVTYAIKGEQCVIMDVYVLPEERRSGLLFSLVDQVVEKAKIAHCKWLIGKVFLADPNHAVNLMVCLKYGYHVAEANNEVIILIKNIGGN